jgi:hypothetical protein
MWSLLPQIVACYEEFGVDYMEHIEVPVLNFISRGSEVLLSNPDYLKLVRSSFTHGIQLLACLYLCEEAFTTMR